MNSSTGRRLLSQAHRPCFGAALSGSRAGAPVAVFTVIRRLPSRPHRSPACARSGRSTAGPPGLAGGGGRGETPPPGRNPGPGRGGKKGEEGRGGKRGGSG